ncbi:uncharacterized protein TNCV_124171 [Trichonephila clavipes]|nr:uncharacterized protein TNCV_124171 [Trichonephila clavipes]
MKPLRICHRWFQEKPTRGTTASDDSDGSRSHITNHSATDSICYASFGVRSYLSTPFAAEWNYSLLRLLLTGNYRRLHHQLCDKRRTCTTKWNDIFFTDESCLCLQHHDGRNRVWRHRDERQLNCSVMHRHTGPVLGIMVCCGTGFHCIR